MGVFGGGFWGQVWGLDFAVSVKKDYPPTQLAPKPFPVVLTNGVYRKIHILWYLLYN